MKNYKFKYLIFIIFIIFSSELFADNSEKFLSLKNSEVNLRQGPSFDYPIKLVYKKKFLPVIIMDKSETWRQIKDFKNNIGWIHVSQLSKKKSGINIKNNSIMYEKPTIFSKPMAKLEKGRLVLILKCNKKWCKVKTKNFKGWIEDKNIWGATK